MSRLCAAVRENGIPAVCIRPHAHAGMHEDAVGWMWIAERAPRSASYELGRARGYVTGRAEPTERDVEWWAAQPGDREDDLDAMEIDDFETGMLDGRDQAVSARLSLPCPTPPSPEALAAARERSS